MGMATDRSAPTIFAPSTAAGRAAIAIVRVSGSRAGEALAALAAEAPDWRPVPRFATRARLVDPESGAPLDQALVLWFPAPHSYTGEDMAELHLHGGRAVVQRVLGALGRLADLRPAAPGEFTRRAFDAGKLDLTEVEGLADLVAAETAAQARQALRQLEGELGRLYEDWRLRLLRALAHAEAEIDFPDEDLPQDLMTRLVPVITDLVGEIRRHLDDERRGERLREGISIAIVGPPNAGKSSLLNALARREAAIVAATAGTTRDIIEVQLDLGGYPVVVADTAGLRDFESGTAADSAQGAIEAEGIRRARARAEAADLKLLVLDATTFEGEAALDPLLVAMIDADTLVVVNKIDLVARDAGRPLDLPLSRGKGSPGERPWPISVKTGEGLQSLLAALTKRVSTMLESADTAAPLLTRARHRFALESCVSALGRAQDASAPELQAEDLRLAVRALGRITGRVGVEDILDIVFREFCIGK